MTSHLQWEEFVKRHLLCGSVVSGVCLVSPHGVPLYTHGDLDNTDQAELRKILPVFRAKSSTGSIVLSTGRGKKQEYKVYQKTYCSLYATAPGKSDGLIVSNLPHGILLCTYRHPVLSGVATQHVEQFCDLLRA